MAFSSLCPVRATVGYDSKFHDPTLSEERCDEAISVRGYLSTVGYDSKLHDPAFSEDPLPMVQQTATRAPTFHESDPQVASEGEAKDYSYRYF